MKAKVLNHLPAAELGEGPLWDAASQSLSWVDITGFKVNRFHPATQALTSVDTGSHVGFVAIDSHDKIVAGLRDGIYELNGLTKRLLAQPVNMPGNNRFNDGKVSPDGRLFCGTMNLQPGDNPPTGSLYRLDGGGLTVVATDIYISNGLGWSPDLRVMYYTDTLSHAISCFDYDPATGAATNRRNFVTIPEHEGDPDGLCVDSAGRVYSAMWGGSCVNIYTPDGKKDGMIAVDALQPSCVTFGGEDLRTLFITTARVDMTPDQLRASPLSGKLFEVENMPALGQPSTRFSHHPQAMRA